MGSTRRAREARAVRAARGATHPGLHGRVPDRARRHPAVDAVRAHGAAGMGRVLGRRDVAARTGGVQAERRHVGRRGARERRVRPARRVGADALSSSRDARSRMRWSTCRSRCRRRWRASR